MRLGVEAAVVDGRLVRGDVEVDGSAVRAVGVGGGTGHGIAVPGFVDLQVNGFAGVDLAKADEAGYARAGEAMLATGVTAYQPTFVTGPEETIVAALRAMPGVDAELVGGETARREVGGETARREVGGATAGRAGAGPRILGGHLEGPFLSPRRPGAHDPRHLRAPDPALLERLLAAGPVRHVTLAPELDGALELVDLLANRGITVAAGHTDATAAQAHAAFDRAATTVTHLFNAMRPPTSRDPGIAFAALAREDVTVQLIVDGHHLAPETVQAVRHAKPRRLALVTDAVAAAGAPDGAYTMGSVRVTAAKGKVTDERGHLAGSALTMIEAVRNLHRLGAPLEQAVHAATAVPAGIARRPDLGRLAPGAAADVVILDDRLEIAKVLIQGEVVVAAA